jgi:uncharacterized membrane protein
MLAIFGKSSGIWSSAALACEAELLFLAGLRFDSRFIRGLAGALFGCSLLRLALVLPDGVFPVAGHGFREYTPALLFHAALFYFNRTLRRRAILYSHLATALVTLVLLVETPYYAIGLSLALFGFVLLELSISETRQDLRLQAYVLLLLSVAAFCIDLLLHMHGIWWPHAAVIAVLLLCAVRVRHLPGIAVWFVFGASACAAVLFWRTLSHDAVALAWAAIGCALAVASNRPSLSRLNQHAPLFTFAALIAACVVDIQPARLAISIPCALLFYACQFVQRRTAEPPLPLYYSVSGTFLAVAILFGRVTGGMLTVSWGLLGVALLGSGFAARERVLRLQGLVLLLICILKLFFYDLRNLETLYRILSFVALGLILLAVSWIYTRFRDQITRLL